MYTSLHLAAESGKIDTVEALIKHGANVHGKTSVSYMYMYIIRRDNVLSFFAIACLLLIYLYTV